MRPRVVSCWVYTSSAPFCWRAAWELRAPLLLTSVSRRDEAIMRQIVKKLPGRETLMAAKPANVNGRSTIGSRRRVWEQSQRSETTCTGRRARTDAKECTKARKRTVRRSKSTGTSNVFKPTHLLHKEALDGKGSYTEHTCYDCGANEEVNPTPEGFLPAQEGSSK